jgi:hypothetical protein
MFCELISCWLFWLDKGMILFVCYLSCVLLLLLFLGLSACGGFVVSDCLERERELGFARPIAEVWAAFTDRTACSRMPFSSADAT